MLTIMEVDEPGTFLLTESLSSRETLDWLKVHEGIASQWTEDAQFTDQEHHVSVHILALIAMKNARIPLSSCFDNQ